MIEWNLSDVYSFEDTEKLISELQALVKDFKEQRSKLSPELSQEDFVSFLKKKETIIILTHKLGAYAELWMSTDTADSKRLAHESKISELCAEIDNDVMFFSLWFKELDDASAQKFIDASPEYRYLLERIRVFKPHALKEKEEQIINLKDLTGCSAHVKLYDTITNKYTFSYKEKEMTQEEINQYKQSSVREERVAANKLVLSRYGQDKDVLSELYRNIVNDCKNENLKLRNYKTPISAMNLTNDIPDEAIQALLDVIRKNVSVFQEYFALKAKVCGLDAMDRYDLYAPYSSKGKEYPYEESKQFTLETYKQFDARAHDFAQKIFDEEHVHAFPKKGKRSGAFCMDIVPGISPYIMLNHVGKLHDLFTMMHEFGHGIHDLAAAKQGIFYSGAVLPMAETASTFGEMLLSQRLLKDGAEQEKIDVLVKMLDGQYASIIRQAYFILFEIAAHEKIAQGATLDDLNELYMSLLKEQFGDMPIPEEFQYEWMYIPHIFHTPFYCYAYAFGNLLVLALYNLYQKEPETFPDKYFAILSAGCSESPSNILKDVGFDITDPSFWQQGFDMIKEEIEELRTLTEKSI